VLPDTDFFHGTPMKDTHRACDRQAGRADMDTGRDGQGWATGWQFTFPAFCTVLWCLRAAALFATIAYAQLTTPGARRRQHISCTPHATMARIAYETPLRVVRTIPTCAGVV